MTSEVIKNQIYQQLFEKLELAYLCVDRSLKIVELSGKLDRYGYGAANVGDLVSDHFDFMVGLDGQTKLDLPLVISPSGIPVSVSLIPRSDILTILFTDASSQAQQRQALQQKANENELLLRRQGILMDQIEQASNELESKNEALQEASQLQSLFLSGVSHEFRTPLTSIIGYANLLQNDVKEESLGSRDLSNGKQTSSNYLRAVRRSSKHLLSLVENLLDHGKLDADEIIIRPKVCSLSEVFDDVYMLLKPLADTKQVMFKVRQDFPNSIKVVTDDSRLRQCLLNIVGNAVKFTDKGVVEVEASLNEEDLSVRVKDTGAGISADDLKKIRLPFYQAPDTGKAGTGLGLTITERLIALMGGDMSIESTLNVGTQVQFNLPVALVSDEDAKADDVTACARPISILLVEDDTDIADLMVVLLGERNVKVTHVGNGALALDAVRHADFDLILMDIHMPIMNGYDAMLALKESGNTIPVAIMSASGHDNDRRQAQELGCKAYILKPVDIDELLVCVTQLLA